MPWRVYQRLKSAASTRATAAVVRRDSGSHVSSAAHRRDELRKAAGIRTRPLRGGDIRERYVTSITRVPVTGCAFGRLPMTVTVNVPLVEYTCCSCAPRSFAAPPSPKLQS